MQTPSSFDYAIVNQGGKRTRAFLQEMKTYIPYEPLEKLLIEERVYCSKKQGEGRRRYATAIDLQPSS